MPFFNETLYLFHFRKEDAMIRLLVVEDEPLLQDLYKKQFEQSGYSVIVAGDKNEALRQLMDASPDVIILDIDLHDADGLSLMLEMLEIRNTIPIIISSAYSSYMADFKCWPAKAFIIKSGELTELKREIDEFAQDSALLN